MRRPQYYRDRTVLVTGASGGIGAEMARQLGATGARLILVARSEGALERVAADVRQRGGTAVPVVADLEPPAAAAALAGRLADAGEAVDVLVNNAGFGVQGPFLEAPSDAAVGMVGLNVTALTDLTRRLLPAMVARGRGGVLNVGSVAGFGPAPRFAVYAATKAYVLSFSDALYAEVRRTGVHVSCLCPGPVATGFAARAGMADRFFDRALPVERVAREGLDGLAAGRRRVVPGVVGKAQALGARLGPPALALRAAQAIMARANPER